MKYIVGNPIRAPIRAYGAHRALIGSPTTPPLGSAKVGNR